MEKEVANAVGKPDNDISDAFKTSISGVTYFNPLHPNHGKKMSMKQTGGTDLSVSTSLEKLRRQSVKMIETFKHVVQCVW
eukprot:g1256.t1